MKIYVVKSSCGEYEDYSIWNEKAFYKKEDAEKYAKELDTKHREKPSFITDDFINNLYDCEYRVPEWASYEGPTNPIDVDEYRKWVREQQNKEIELLIKYMAERGHELTKEKYEIFEEWNENAYREWHDCSIEELEIV